MLLLLQKYSTKGIKVVVMWREGMMRCGKGKGSVEQIVLKIIKEGISLEREMIKQLSKAELLSVPE